MCVVLESLNLTRKYKHITEPSRGEALRSFYYILLFWVSSSQPRPHRTSSLVPPLPSTTVSGMAALTPSKVRAWMESSNWAKNEANVTQLYQALFNLYKSYKEKSAMIYELTKNEQTTRKMLEKEDGLTPHSIRLLLASLDVKEDLIKQAKNRKALLQLLPAWASTLEVGAGVQPESQLGEMASGIQASPSATSPPRKKKRSSPGGSSSAKKAKRLVASDDTFTNSVHVIQARLLKLRPESNLQTYLQGLAYDALGTGHWFVGMQPAQLIETLTGDAQATVMMLSTMKVHDVRFIAEAFEFMSTSVMDKSKNELVAVLKEIIEDAFEEGEDGEVDSEEDSEEDKDDISFPVNKIVDKQTFDGTTLFRVRWDDCGTDADT